MTRENDTTNQEELIWSIFYNSVRAAWEIYAEAIANAERKRDEALAEVSPQPPLQITRAQLSAILDGAEVYPNEIILPPGIRLVD